VSDIDIGALIAFHKSHGRLGTITAVIPPGRYGALDLEPDGHVKRFIEKPPGDNNLINGGFLVVERQVIDSIEGDNTSFEGEPLVALARDDELVAYRHTGFWQAMDTLRDKNYLEGLWASRQAPWKVWA
jgi:glucose-1-phosphate cytidylyltransferase